MHTFIHSHRSARRSMIAGGLTLALSPTVALAANPRQPDFNGDGYADLIMPASGEKIGQEKSAGAVNIVYGSVDGAKTDLTQMISQGADGINETAEAYDRFGRRVAFGDFNADGYSDLAVSATGEDTNSGSVSVIYGSASGLSSSGNQVLRHGIGGVLGVRDGFEYFGYALAVGDFNGDGKDDLAIGGSDETAAGVDDAGVVHVLYGSAAGITAVGNQLWYQGGGGLQGAPENGDYFGMEIAVGDFNGDGKDDLAASAPYENGNNKFNCGAVNVIFGSSSGLTSAGNQFWHQDSPGIANKIDGYEYFGWSLTAGDFDGDGRTDLAIGADSENIDGVKEAGAVHVLYGGNNGLRSAGSQFWTQNSTGVGDQCEAEDRFGSTLESGDFNGDGRADLAIGVLDENIGSVSNAGAMHVFYGSATGLVSTGNQFWSQDSKSIAGVAAAGDHFGSFLVAADFDGDGKDDLAVGVPYEKVGSVVGAGAINLIYGTANKGLRAARNQLWSQDSDGVGDKCEKNDNVGYDGY